MLTVVLGLATAFDYALQDFLMIPVARVTSAVAGVLWIRVVALAGLVVLAAFVGHIPSGGDQWRAAGIAALGGALEVAAFTAWLTALSVGKLSVVSPLASLSSAFTVLFVVVIGQPVATAVWIVLPLALVGSALTSLEPDPEGGRPRSTAAGAGWAAVAAATFGLVTICFGEASALPPVSVGLFAGTATVVVLLPIVLIRRTYRVERRFRRRVVVCGLLDTGALLAFAAATAMGSLSVVGILVAQTGTMAVVLGMVLLRERPARSQLVGIVLTLVAVTILAGVG
jgi:drug/metabolite transporter (DMT)-like permease